MAAKYRSGFITLVGRPNAGKSTILNALLGEKVAIVTHKPQTTRDRILGILPVENGQIVVLDTPGVHRGKRALNKHMTDVALSSIGDVDAVLFVLDAPYAASHGLHPQDERIIAAIAGQKKSAIAVLNKMDLVSTDKVLALVTTLSELHPFAAIVPVSAKKQRGLDILRTEACALMPEGQPLYPEDELTDRPLRFLVAELLREQIILAVGQEVPYSVAVEVTSFKQRADRDDLVDIDATIHVERDSQKGILLGKGGAKMKEIARAARHQMEDIVGQKVFLRTHIRVEPNWTRKPQAMRKLGYDK